jgi:hypothetical protein
MAAAGLIVEFLFQGLGLTRTQRNAKVEMANIHWNYTTVLNIVFLSVAAVLVWRFTRTGGVPMLRMMNKPLDQPPQGAHAHSG